MSTCMQEPKEIVLARQFSRKWKGHRSIISTITKRMYYIPLLKSLAQFIGNKFINDEVSYVISHLDTCTCTCSVVIYLSYV